MIKYNDWIKNFDDEEIEEIEEIFSCGDEIIEVYMGYMDKEHAAYGYFDGRSPIYARVFNVKDAYILCIPNEYFYEEPQVYFTEIDVTKAAEKLENSLYPGIDEQIENFKLELNMLNINNLVNTNDVDIYVKRKYNYSDLYSFNVYYNDKLILDDIKTLDTKRIYTQIISI